MQLKKQINQHYRFDNFLLSYIDFNILVKTLILQLYIKTINQQLRLPLIIGYKISLNILTLFFTLSVTKSNTFQFS